MPGPRGRDRSGCIPGPEKRSGRLPQRLCFPCLKTFFAVSCSPASAKVMASNTDSMRSLKEGPFLTDAASRILLSSRIISGLTIVAVFIILHAPHFLCCTMQHPCLIAFETHIAFMQPHNQISNRFANCQSKTTNRHPRAITKLKVFEFPRYCILQHMKCSCNANAGGRQLSSRAEKQNERSKPE